ncbi:mortality factor 4-like protein 1 [Eurytemora carolleeae]|uniref:mortality factor 4-like protein 1 n=1 Tax=Eurytemora carolleeae TaxID=1294199 RepID=UPI000C77C27A|nr:mortality factor 4-like protein 1 [Eurytemora carolleeae]|eukprot:XP_023326931.1 mortality factor 4-like protein 1 [Eurytemora affinis]
MTRSKYVEGETVLCFQGIMIYEAKVQGVRKEDGIFEFDIHYKGWNKTWDEWVTEERLLKFTPENQKRMKEVEEELAARGKTYASKKSGGGAISQKNPESSPEPSSGDKRKQEMPLTEGKKQKVTDPTLKNLGIMKGLKPRSRSNSNTSILSTKSNTSTKQEERPKRSVKDIKVGSVTPDPKPAPGKKPGEVKEKKPGDSKKPGESKEKKKPKKAENQGIQNRFKPKEKTVAFGEGVRIELSEELKNVLVDDFDYMIRQRKLLSIPSRYTVEDNKNIPLCQLYGPVHLLRLITKLGPMLSATSLDKTSLALLLDNVKDFIEYIGRHRETLFQIEDYGTASPEYHRRAI